MDTIFFNIFKLVRIFFHHLPLTISKEYRGSSSAESWACLWNFRHSEPHISIRCT